MAVGRISGQLLKDNLLRDGVNLRFENDLMYLLVSDADGDNHKVGIKTANPAYTLDVNGTTRSTNILGTTFEVGDVHIENNVINSTAGALIFEAATDNDEIRFNNNVLINGNLHATGAITADGDLTLGDANTDNVVFGADINSDIIPNITNTYDLGTSSKRWRTSYQQNLWVGDIYISEHTIYNLTGDIKLSANGIVEIASPTKITDTLQVIGNITLGDIGIQTFNIDTLTPIVNLVNDTATVVNFAGSADTVNIGANTGSTNINNNLDVVGDVTIDGGDLEATTEEFNLLNTAVTKTVNFAGGADTVNIGADSGYTNIKNNLDVTGDVTIDGGDLDATTEEFNLLNTAVTKTVNFAGGADNINIGSSEGTTNINNNLDVVGDVQIDGGDLTVSTEEFNLANTTAKTVNFAGEANTVSIGSSEGFTNVNNNLNVTADVTIDGGDLKASTEEFNLLNDTTTKVNFAGEATDIQIGSDQGDTNVNNNLTVDGVTNVQKELTVEGDTTVNSKLTVEGIVDVNNSLYVTGNTDLSESLTVQGSTSVQKELVVEGNTQMNRGLSVEGELKAGKLVDTIIDCGEY
jgi:trimeric autotransporter adhesin